MEGKEYTVKEMKALLEGVSGMYDLARVVDPIECRILEFQNDESVTTSNRCYGIWNADQKCVNCSSAVACKTGCHQEKVEVFQKKAYHIQSNPIKLRLSDGAVYNAVLELVSVGEESESAGAVPFNDRAAENAEAAAFRYRAMHDSLTGALKSDAFYESARELMAKNDSETWVMVTGDIMKFKLFNSLFGIEKGNEVLVKTAEELEKIARRSGGLCGRLYRDKFAVLLPGNRYREEDFIAVAEAVKRAFSNGIYMLYLHFGVYETNSTDIPVSIMCDRANLALKTVYYDVHRTVARFDGDIMQKNLMEQEIISSFDKALKEGHFQMYLQPLADQNGVPFGAEALVRWVRPDGTVIPPAAFIETLENAGLIHELDRNVWEQAVKQLRAWKDSGKENLTISVNMSAKDFYNMDIYRVLTGLTEKYGVDNAKLRVEITESAVVDDPERSYSVLAKLQEAGFLIEIDDFGKGQSSLSLLKDVQADILKIDMGFLRETENVKRSRIILKAVIAMANKLGMQVISEGVETEKQLQSLVSMGCSCFQGFYFSKPIPIGEFEAKYLQGTPA